MIDVSGSMHGTPLYAAIALGILVSKFLPAPWTNKFLTFSEEPIMLDFTKHKDSIYKTVKFINRAPWGGSTDFMLAHE